MWNDRVIFEFDIELKLERLLKRIVLVLTVLIVVFWQVTYVLEGTIAHEDFCGHKGRLNPGDLQVQWHENL